MKKALVLAGGIPQVDLILKLKQRGIYTILADCNESPVAKHYSDEFYRISTLDLQAIRCLAKQERVDFIITVCTDQAILTVAQVSEQLSLPCFIDSITARNVTNKAYMKHVLLENFIPTAKCYVTSILEEEYIKDWQYPMVVKPVDCNSSKGVIKVTNIDELKTAFLNAVDLSRTNTAIIEEFIEGKEISVDVYVENGKAIVLDITTSEKLQDEKRFVIFVNKNSG